MGREARLLIRGSSVSDALEVSSDVENDTLFENTGTMTQQSPKPKDTRTQDQACPL